METLDTVNDEFLAKGKRGFVYKTLWKGKVAVVKRLNPQTTAHAALTSEARHLREVNALGIGPKLLDVQEDGIVMEFIDGERILDFFGKHPVPVVKKICKDVLQQCRTLDKAGLNKLEMTNPYKHVIIRKARGKNARSFQAIMIDFERCHYSEHPKNVTQFLQFLSSGRVKNTLKGKLAFDQEKLWQLAAEYKKDFSEKNFKKILKAL